MELVYDALVDVFTSTRGRSGPEWALARAAVPCKFNNTGTQVYGGAHPERPEPKGTFRIPKGFNIAWAADSTALRVILPDDALHAGLGWLVTEVRWADDHLRLLTLQSVALPAVQSVYIA